MVEWNIGQSQRKHFFLKWIGQEVGVVVDMTKSRMHKNKMANSSCLIIFILLHHYEVTTSPIAPPLH